MKKALKTMLLAVITASLVTVASAEPPGKAALGLFRKASTVEEIQKLKKGSRYALVCKECESITVKEVASAEEVEALCHDGGKIHCESCEKKLTVKRVGPPGKETTIAKVTIVNDKGDECMFVVPLE